MAETKITYDIATDFSGAKVDSTKLHAAIKADSALAAKYLRIDTIKGTNECHVCFSSALDAAEQTTLGMPPTPATGSIIGDHDGKAPTRIKFHTVFKLVADDRSVTAVTPGWDYLGASIGRVGFLADVNKAKAHITICYKSDDGGAVLRLVENDGTSDVVMKTKVLADTEGVWKPFEFSTKVGTDPAPRDTLCEYRLLMEFFDKPHPVAYGIEIVEI